MYFFTADEHYGHEKIIEYCNRPFNNVKEMDEVLINNHNSVVGKDDITVHIGDFGWFKKEADAYQIIRQLNGNHIFVRGSHDRWMRGKHPFMWRKLICNQYIVCCHYAMRTWERARFGSWQLYGHSHGTLSPIGKQMDVGVDCNEFTPMSFDQIKAIMETIATLHGPKHD